MASQSFILTQISARNALIPFYQRYSAHFLYLTRPFIKLHVADDVVAPPGPLRLLFAFCPPTSRPPLEAAAATASHAAAARTAADRGQFARMFVKVDRKSQTAQGVAETPQASRGQRQPEGQPKMERGGLDGARGGAGARVVRVSREGPSLGQRHVDRTVRRRLLHRRHLPEKRRVVLEHGTFRTAVDADSHFYKAVDRAKGAEGVEEYVRRAFDPTPVGEEC